MKSNVTYAAFLYSDTASGFTLWTVAQVDIVSELQGKVSHRLTLKAVHVLAPRYYFGMLLNLNIAFFFGLGRPMQYRLRIYGHECLIVSHKTYRWKLFDFTPVQK